jgi:tRNA A37 methylthiotransferase MiaB
MKKAIVLIQFVECPRNVLFRYRLEDYLKANGYLIVPPAAIHTCHLVVFCSCGVTVRQQDTNLQFIKYTRKEMDRQKNSATFIVTGCLPAQNKKRLNSIHDGPSFSHKELHRFDHIINSKVKIDDISNRMHITTGERKPRLIFSPPWHGKLVKLKWIINNLSTYIPKKSRQMRSALGMNPDFPFDYYQMGDETWCVTTSSGCIGRCSYCVIRKAKGKIKSRPKDVIIQEVRQGVEKGFKWISLVADDNGSYGKDIGTSLTDLLKDLFQIKRDFNILIDSLGPSDFNRMYNDLLPIIESGKLNRLTLAVQHVNERILSSMKRNYDVNQFKKNLFEINSKVKNFTIDFHFMPGYPGETEEEFYELLSFAKWIVELNPNNSWKAYTFSAVPGTIAASLSGQIPDAIRRQRTQILDSIHNKRRSLHSSN